MALEFSLSIYPLPEGGGGFIIQQPEWLECGEVGYLSPRGGDGDSLINLSLGLLRDYEISY